MIKLDYQEALAFKKMGFKEETDGYFVKQIPVESCSPENWNTKGRDYVAMLNVYQAVEFLSLKKGIYISFSIRHNAKTHEIELVPTITYTRNGCITFKNEIKGLYFTVDYALYDGVKNVLETLNKL